MVKVDVNNSEAQMSVLEASVSDLSDVVDDHNPDCFVIVYAVDDMESFGKFKNDDLKASICCYQTFPNDLWVQIFICGVHKQTSAFLTQNVHLLNLFLFLSS